MSSKINVGIVGAGLIGKDHANSIHRLPTVGSVTIFDADTARAKAVAEPWNLKIASSVDELIKTSDIVWIATPPFAHKQLVQAAAAAKKAIFCEKPLAHTLEDATAIRNAVREAKVPLFMGQSGRYTTGFMIMKKILDRGDIGKPNFIFSTRLGYLDPKMHPAWRTDDEKSGGMIVELGVHEIDYVHWFCGPYKSLAALGSCNTSAGEKFQDSITSIGTLKSGVQARVEVSWSDARYLWERGIRGDQGSIYINDSNFVNIQVHRPGKEVELVNTGETDWMDRKTLENLTLRVQDAAVIDALIAGKPPAVTVDDGHAAVEIAMLMRKAAKSGKVESV